MKGLRCALAAGVVAAMAVTAFTQSKDPLVLASQGSYFVGGESKAVAGGDITINQMYVQYQTPVKGGQHVPVVMVHGCCLSSKTWETTPDGRMGWSEYFVRKDRSVYLADQVSRARSGFDPTIFSAVKAGTAPPSQLPNVLSATPKTSFGKDGTQQATVKSMVHTEKKQR